MKPKPLSDCLRATLFLYLSQRGLPPWKETDKQIQIKALAIVAGWDKKRASVALRKAVQAGYADTKQ